MSGRVSMTVPQYRRGECTIDGHVQRLSPRQREVLALLLVSPPWRFASKTALIGWLFPNPDDEPECAEKCLGDWLMDLRRFGVPIENDFGFGWRIPITGRHNGFPLFEQRMVA